MSKSLSLNLVNEPAQIDPVCGMTVDPAHAAGSFAYQGQTYYFCSASCLRKFQANPERYLHPEARHEAMEPAAAGTAYSCPMHPQIESDKPAACPICGMALEPRVPTADEGPNPELVDMTRRFKWSLALGLPVFVIAMADMLPGGPLHSIDMRLLNWVQLVLATPVVLWCGWPFFERAWQSIVHRSPNMFTLIALGVGAAYLDSLLATIAPGLFPAGFRTMHGAVEPYFDTAAMVTALVLLGQVLELRARSQTSSAIRRLLGLAPKTARRIDADGRETDVPLTDFQPGDRLRVRPGEKVPTDGVVIEGRSAVDESMVSGEPIPVEKEPESKLIGGTVNGNGPLVMRAEKVGSDTLLAQIVRMVLEAQRSRAPVERLVDQISRFFVPAVLGAAIVTFVAWSLWGPEPRLAHGLVNAVAVMIIACPCALGLATPMAIMVGTGRGAESGVLFRNAEALERLAHADVLVVDKTGTLTEGQPQVVNIRPQPGFSEADVLRLAAGLESGSEHPLASAIVHAADARNLPRTEAREVQTIPGQGIAGIVDGKKVVLGNAAMFRSQGLPDALPSTDVAHTVVQIAIDGALAGSISVADPIRASSAEAIRLLHAEGMRLIILTGDRRVTAEAVAQSLGIDEVIAEVLPAQKEETVARLQRKGHIVAMAGDGVNDAPALARADVGIAMGTGTDVAMESAGVTLVRGDLRGIARARRLSRATLRNIRQNLFLAFAYNVLSIPIAAGVLYPVFGILISPIWAGAAMSLSSVSVVGNALRLRKQEI
ncbi:MAG: heavy metal translocating P-type ATPase [Gemmataceae bacterium]